MSSRVKANVAKCSIVEEQSLFRTAEAGLCPVSPISGHLVYTGNEPTRPSIYRYIFPCIAN